MIPHVEGKIKLKFKTSLTHFSILYLHELQKTTIFCIVVSTDNLRDHFCEMTYSNSK